MKKSENLSPDRGSIPPGSIVMHNSLDFSVSINDTIFIVTGMGTSEKIDFNDIRYLRHMTFSGLKPEIKISLKNTASQPYMIYLDDRLIRPFDVASTKIGLGYYFGSDTNSKYKYHSPWIHLDVAYVRYKLIKPGENTDETTFNPLAFIDSISSGNYWVQVVYRNQYWENDSIPVWIGEIYSDTLWFRVIDSSGVNSQD